MGFQHHRHFNTTVILFCLWAAAVTPAGTATVGPDADYTTIQAAVDGATEGDVIVLAPGVYSGDGNRDIDFGGKAITVRSEDPCDPDVVATTIIDCNGTRDAPHRGFFFHTQETGDSVVAGLTIRNGYASAGSEHLEQQQWSGGGILCMDSNPTVARCVITGNTAYNGQGGGLATHGGLVTHCVIEDNRVYGQGEYGPSGSGISCGGDAQVQHCIIVENTTREIFYGTTHPAVHCTSGHPAVVNCLIVGNDGGGLELDYFSEAQIRNCTISDNRGNAVEAVCSPSSISNCIISEGTIFLACAYGRTPLTIDHSALHSTVVSGYADLLELGPGVLTADPLWAEPSYWRPTRGDYFFVMGDYHLMSEAGRWNPITAAWAPDDVTSPCIDAGNPNSAFGLEPVPNGGIVNMGAYGGTAEASKSTMPYSDIDLQFEAPPFDLDQINASFARGVAYGPYEENVFDIFLVDAVEPTPLVIYIHGGGFTNGTKGIVYVAARKEIREVLASGASYATIDYRLLEEVDDEGVIKSLTDSRRCLQFLRYHHEQLNVDPAQIAIYGASAGAGTCLWLAFNDDMADPNAVDPVLRESTRVSVIAGKGAQSTYDLTKWETVVFASLGMTLEDMANLPNASEQSLLSFYGADEIEDITSPETQAYRQAVDMLELMSPDDPPFWVWNDIENPGIPTSQSELLHHGLHAVALRDRANEVGLECQAYAPALDVADPAGEKVIEFMLARIGEAATPALDPGSMQDGE